MEAKPVSAMKIDLSKYLTQRYQDSLAKQDFEGPVVTIAREYGCPSQKLAARLAEKLNLINSSLSKKIKWRWINKEILYESAKILKLHPSDIEYVFNFEKKNFFDDILSSQSSKYYKSDRKIRNTIASVIRNLASEGNVIIVGRGGVAITREVERSLHVNLEAPIEWRALRLSEKFCMSEKETRKLATEIDKKRKEFRNYFHGVGTDYTRFDVRYNCMTLSIDDITHSIISLLQARKFV
jgi:cytidylate kinase